jgi:hypothetical protein
MKFSFKNSTFQAFYGPKFFQFFILNCNLARAHPMANSAKPNHWGQVRLKARAEGNQLLSLAARIPAFFRVRNGS